MIEQAEVIIIGAGASGLMCAIEAGRRGRRVLVIDHGPRPGRKILLTGGGRCNFTNYQVEAGNYVSRNPDFCRSALSRFTPGDFLSLVRKHRISYSEREHGQLFCNGSSRDILDLLLTECEQARVSFQLNTKVKKVELKGERDFAVHAGRGSYVCRSLVAATGGLSLPSVGAGPLGYEIAEQFRIRVWPRSAGLVPFTLPPRERERLASLSGIAVEAEVGNPRHRTRENLLFTHRGLSGPAALQMSLYWQPGETLTVNLLPELDLADALKEHRRRRPQRKVKTVLAEYLPQRLVAVILRPDLAERSLQETSLKQFREISAEFQQWTVRPSGTEGYRTAEVTLGGVDCDEISSQTMEARRVAGLFFTGEVLDVTGWLGGYNLQWAWSSGWCAGQYA